MDKAEMERRLRAGNFIENNGSVLRTINILRYKFNKLSAIKYALDISEAEIVDCVNFLAEAEYIELRQISTRAPADLADVPFEEIEAKLTEKGIRLLAGGLKDDLIRI
jgi:hypothetical protein